MGSEDHHRGLKVLVKLGGPGQGRRQCGPTRYSAVPAYDTDHRTTILVFCFASYLKFRSFRTRQVYFGIDVVCGQVHVRGLSLLFFGIEATVGRCRVSVDIEVFPYGFAYRIRVGCLLSPAR